MEEHLLRTLSSLDLGLRYTGYRVLEMGDIESLDPVTVAPLLKAQADRLPFVRAIYLYDKKGKGRSSSSGADIRHLNGFDYEQIRFLSQATPDRLYIGRAVTGQCRNYPVFHIHAGLWIARIGWSALSVCCNRHILL